MMIVIMIMMIVVNDLCEGSIGKLCGKQSDPFVRFEFDFEFVFSFVSVRILSLSLPVSLSVVSRRRRFSVLNYGKLYLSVEPI